jgi:hypothetical protein
LKDADDVTFFKAVATHFIKHNREDPKIVKLAIYSSLEGKHFGELVRADESYPNMLDLITRRIRSGIDEDRYSGESEIAARLFVEAVFMYVADQTSCISGPKLDYPDDEVVDTLVSIYLKGLIKK